MVMDLRRRNDAKVTCIILGAAGAGKTSILRRFFTGSFDDTSARTSTLGSDFYTGRVRNRFCGNSKDGLPQSRVDGVDMDTSDGCKDAIVQSGKHRMPRQQRSCPFVTVHMWDTAGRERKAKYTAALGDEFFQHGDATMLVYDATSSTSFTQLIKWHADLKNRMEELQQSVQMPVLVVANKMDIIEQMEQSKPERRSTRTPQRDVLGMNGKNFRGKDMHYEYSVNRATGGKRKGSRVSASTYMATGDTWTTDGSYLDSVLHSEDGSHADRDMVMLWCMRNGLQHFEVSARNGEFHETFDGLFIYYSKNAPCWAASSLNPPTSFWTGIEKAMEALVQLALESKHTHSTMASMRSRRLARSPSVSNQDNSMDSENNNHKDNRYFAFRPNEELDLHARYAPKNGLVCFGLGCLFRSCISTAKDW